jgi:hypothetical protein
MRSLGEIIGKLGERNIRCGMRGMGMESESGGVDSGGDKGGRRGLTGDLA